MSKKARTIAVPFPCCVSNKLGLFCTPKGPTIQDLSTQPTQSGMLLFILVTQKF